MYHKRHINEFLKSGFNNGRAAGHGMVEDSYGEESDPGNEYQQFRSVPIAEREIKEEYPVKTYFISCNDENE